MEDWTTPWALGDVEITASARILHGGFEPDSLGEYPFLRYQLGGGLLYRLGTGEQPDPDRFLHLSAGDGQADMEAGVFGLRIKREDGETLTFTLEKAQREDLRRFAISQAWPIE